MRLWLLALFSLFIGCLGVLGVTPGAVSAMVQKERLAPPLQVTPYDEGLWLHTSYQYFNDYLFPSHGLIVEGDEAVILIDTGWSDENTQDLIDWIETELDKPITHLIVTHAHEDKMSGAEAIKALGAKVHAHRLTAEDAAGRGLPSVGATFDRAETVSIRGASVEAFYPGAGHTRDNIVVRVNGTDVLYGGCFIRPAASSGPGNTGDADIAAWPDSVRAVMARYPDIERVIPSHGAPGDRSLLSHTISVVQAHEPE